MNNALKEILEEKVAYHFNYSFIKTPKSFGKVRLFQIGDMVCKSAHEIKDHKQCCFELTCVLEGELIVYCNDVPFKLQTDMIFLSLPNETHKIKIDNQPSARFVFLGFDVLTNHPLYNDLEDLITKHKQINQILNKSHNIIEIMMKCLQEVSATNIYSNILIEGYLNEIIVLILKEINNYAINNYYVKDKDLLLSNIIFYIENNILEISSVSDICQRFAFSESYLSHFFTKNLGISLYQYIQNLKLRKAIFLLKEGNSVTSVATQLNYSSIYIFSRAFKNKFGTSPTQYIISTHNNKKDNRTEK